MCRLNSPVSIPRTANLNAKQRNISRKANAYKDCDITSQPAVSNFKQTAKAFNKPITRRRSRQQSKPAGMPKLPLKSRAGDSAMSPVDLVPGWMSNAKGQLAAQTYRPH